MQDGRAEGKAAAPQFVKQYRAVIAGGPDAAAAHRRALAGLAVQGQPPGQGVPGQPSPQGRAGSRAGIPHPDNGRGEQPCRDHPAHRAHPSDPGAVRQPQKHPLSGDGKYGSRVKGSIALQSCGLQFRASGHRQAPAVQPAPAGRRTVEGVFRIRLLYTSASSPLRLCLQSHLVPLLALCHLPDRESVKEALDEIQSHGLPKALPLGELPSKGGRGSPLKEYIFSLGERYGTQYRTDAEIYAVLEREIIDLTIRPGSAAERKPAVQPGSGPPLHDPGGFAKAAGKRAGADRAL